MSQTDDDNKKKEQTGSFAPTPEHEPFKYHFDTSGFENIAPIENNESDNTPKESQTIVQTNPPSSHASNQSYTPPIIATSQANQVHAHPPMPLSDEEIETNANTKKPDESINWLALWCVRQLEIFERELNKKQ